MFVEFIQRYSDYADDCTGRITSDVTVPPEFEDAHAEVCPGLRYHNRIEKGLLWSFALRHLQENLEAVLVFDFLPVTPTKPSFGLCAKLRTVAAGRQIDENDAAELGALGNLRNLLSHAPPEQFHPVAVYL